MHGIRSFILFCILYIVYCFPLTALNQGARADEAVQKAEWTVMFYFCGSDLESKYGFATENLKGIYDCEYPTSNLSFIANFYGQEVDESRIVKPGKVNVLIQTGGCKRWHEDALEMDISEDAIQRWRFDCYEDGKYSTERPDGFTLLSELPLHSMADPDTLSDYIRWGAEVCPAEHYALVLWDHGGGSRTGLFIDELFDGERMELWELGNALRAGNVHFDAVLFDACLMAGMETAWAIQDYADWMIASEETVPGKGTAIHRWLQELYNNPGMDAAGLGRCICEMTQIDYEESNNEQADMLTWSVVKLSGIQKLVDLFDRYFAMLGESYQRYPSLVLTHAGFLSGSEAFGDRSEGMHDLADVFFNPYTVFTMDFPLRRDILEAITDTVVYVAHGGERSRARGLSFFYGMGMGEEDIEAYARNCPSLHYLAFLDAVSDWTGPDWIYENTERLPETDTLPSYHITVEKCALAGDAFFPALRIMGGQLATHVVTYRLYHRQEDSGLVIALGEMPCSFQTDENGHQVWYANSPMYWPAVEETVCSMDLLECDDEGALYSIPIQMGNETWKLRCRRTYGVRMSDRLDTQNTDENKSQYEIESLWKEQGHEMSTRQVNSLSRFAGQTYRLLYPTETKNHADHQMLYAFSEENKMYRSMNIEEKAVEAGTYYIEYIVVDKFMHEMKLEQVQMEWDGNHITFPEDQLWTGEVNLCEE